MNAHQPRRRFLRDHGLTIVLVGAFVLFLIGQSITGWFVHNDQRRSDGQSALGLGEYLLSSHWLEATAENWESEFLQMGAFVILTAYLFQIGSPESRHPDEPPADSPITPDSPWPARRGGWIAAAYGYSLSLAFLVLFAVSFLLHGIGGRGVYNEEQGTQGQPPISLIEYMKTSQFWFESFQNWQSEFLAIASMVVLAIFLRQKGSPESKAPATPHWKNEDD